jgi:predicted ABC-type sugar transport system permease subunit
VLLDVVFLIVVLALAAAALMQGTSGLGPQDRPGLRALIGALAVAMLALAVWRGVRDGAWWQVVIGIAVALAYIAFDQARTRRSDPRG